MKISTILAILAGSLIATNAVAQPVQWRVEDGGNGHWYQLYNVPGDAVSAEVHFQIARDAGGHTATISSLAENSFCFSLSQGRSPFIGIRKQVGNNQGAWITDEPWSYTNWFQGEGGNYWERYARLQVIFDGAWQDTDLTPEVYSLIEWDSDCNGDGIVDKGQILSAELADVNNNGVPDVCETQATPVEWVQRGVTGPSPRNGHAMVYDAARGVTVLFGGPNNGETWEWDGIAWSQRLVTGPSPRSDHAMTYDLSRSVSVLFGGFGGGIVGETWEWDGSTWTERAVTGPSPRYAHAMAYDAVRGITVLFGGSDSNGETWEWNGIVWTRRQVSEPTPRSNHAMVYDSRRAVTVLVGGSGTDSINNGETWEWNGTFWSQRSLDGPSPRREHAMAYDAARGVTVLFGGYTTADFGDTWEWNGTVWIQRMISGPSPRREHAMAYDTLRRVTVLFGGVSGAESGDTWELGVPCPLPSITLQPVDAMLVPGHAAHFEMFATDAVSYQWRRNSTAVSNSARISGATSNTLNITGVQSSDQGLYDCVVTNTCGTVTTESASLSCKPIVTQHPLGGTLAAGQVITLAGSATSAGTTTYRWKKDGVNVFNSTVYQGATTPTLSIAPTDPSNSGNYALAITNTCGTTTTQSAVVTVFCSADFNNDGGIDFFDYLDFVDAFSSGLLSADFNGDGGVDFFDYLDFVDRFSIGC